MTAVRGSTLLDVEHLSVELATERGWLSIVDDVSFSVASGEFLGLAGESGSGKTMTALAVMGLLPTRRPRLSGQILFDGRDLLKVPRRAMRHVRGTDISMVFQEPMSSLHPAWSVGEQVAEVVRAHEQVSRRAAWARAVEMLDLVGIPNPRMRAKQYAFQFSGGMQQRVMMAMALVCRPRLLIADEPTTALDVTVQAQIVELLRALQGEFGMAVLFVTHDLGLLAGVADRVVVMYGGQVAEDAPRRELFLRPRHPYTEALVLAAPHPDLKGGRLPSIPGAPPHPARLPTGCRFHPRCSHARDRCTIGAIPVELAGLDHRVRCIRHDELQLAAELERVLS